MKTPLCAALLLIQLAPAAASQDKQGAQPTVEFLSVSWSEAGSPLGFQVHVRGRIADAGLAHRYDVLYQLRVHTQKGEEGPILGDAQNPSGTALILGEADAPDAQGSCAFGFDFDLTRKELTSMTRLQKGRMVLRIEPQIYDKTAQRFITPPKSNALIAVIEVGDRYRVWSVVPFARWLPGCYGESMAKTALDVLASLDALDAEGNGIVPAFEEVFGNEYLRPAELLLFVEALPAEDLAFGKNNLPRIIEDLAQHSDAAVRAAAVEKQKEAAALQAQRR